MEQPASYVDDISGGGGRQMPYADNGSGRGRPRPYAEISDSGRMELPAPYPGDSSSGGGRRPVPYADNGSGRGRPRPTFAGISDIGDEQPAASFAESSGSDRGRPMSMSYAGMRGEQQRQRYGMSDTRLYQNGRYYYDVGTGKYGYGHESNPVGTLPADEEFAGSGYGRAGGEARPGRRYGYGGNAAGFEHENGSDVDGVAENRDGFQENQNEQYIP